MVKANLSLAGSSVLADGGIAFFVEELYQGLLEGVYKGCVKGTMGLGFKI